MLPSSPKSVAAVIAVDTNVVVRLLTKDEEAQFERARELFATETIFLPKTVLLECEWVLRSLYVLPPRQIAQALTSLIALPQVRCEDKDSAAAALDLMRQGLDFADALHLASSGAAERFASFDRALARRARAVTPHIPVAPP